MRMNLLPDHLRVENPDVGEDWGQDAEDYLQELPHAYEGLESLLTSGADDLSVGDLLRIKESHKNGKIKETNVLTAKGKEIAQSMFNDLYVRYDGNLTEIRNTLLEDHANARIKYANDPEVLQRCLRMYQSMHGRLQYMVSSEIAASVTGKGSEELGFKEVLEYGKGDEGDSYQQRLESLRRAQEVKIASELARTESETIVLIYEAQKAAAHEADERARTREPLDAGQLFRKFTGGIRSKARQGALLAMTAVTTATLLAGSVGYRGNYESVENEPQKIVWVYEDAPTSTAGVPHTPISQETLALLDPPDVVKDEPIEVPPGEVQMWEQGYNPDGSRRSDFTFADNATSGVSIENKEVTAEHVENEFAFVSQEAPKYPQNIYSPLGQARAAETVDGAHRWSSNLGDVAKDLPDIDMVYNLPGNRSPENYMAVINHFNVADPENGRYQAVNDEEGNPRITFCNIFVSDVTRAMGVWLPHWREGREISANEYYRWLNSEAARNEGWIEVSKEEARKLANTGVPVVGSVDNETGSGHIWMVVPTPDNYGNIAIAQAGRRNFVGEEMHEEGWFMQPGVKYSEIKYFKNEIDVVTAEQLAQARGWSDSTQMVNFQPEEATGPESRLDEFRVSNTGNPDTPVRFSEKYRETDPTNKEITWIKPQEVILHWDGNTAGPESWTTNATFNGLSSIHEDPETGPRTTDAHFAVGIDGVLQMLPMNEEEVRRSYGAKGYPNVINIEMGGAFFVVNPDGSTNVPEVEVKNVVDLITKLLIQYNIPLEGLVGHYERDLLDIDGDGVLEDRGKPDPGPEFLEFVRGRVEQNLRSLGIDPNELGKPRPSGQLAQAGSGTTKRVFSLVTERVVQSNPKPAEVGLTLGQAEAEDAYQEKGPTKAETVKKGKAQRQRQNDQIANARAQASAFRNSMNRRG